MNHIPSSTLILLKEDLQKLMQIPDYIKAIEEAFRQHGNNKSYGVDMLHGDCPSELQFHIKVGGLEFQNRSFYGLKVNASKFSNMDTYQLPNIMGAIILFDAVHGYPLALLDSIEPTIKRTGAGTAVAFKYLAKKESKVLTICGCGTQGQIQLMSIIEVLPIELVYAYNISSETAQRYVKIMHPMADVEVIATEDLGKAIAKSDVVVTCTPSTQPYIKREWLHPGLTIAAIGADSPNKQELDATILLDTKVVVDILNQCAVAGELHHALDKGLISKENVYAEIGSIVANKKPGRINNEEVIIYDATGTALQDTAAAAVCYLKAIDKNIGNEMNLIKKNATEKLPTLSTF